MTILPMAAEPQTGSRVVPDCAPERDPDSPRILVIDDTPAIHDDFRKILNKVEAPALDEAQAALFAPPQLNANSLALSSIPPTRAKRVWPRSNAR